MAAQGRVSVTASVVSGPPLRHIGSELTTFSWLAALLRAGFDARASIIQPEAGTLDGFTREGIPVHHASTLVAEMPDVLICHADYAYDARFAGQHRPGTKVVLVAHNSRENVEDGVRLTRHDLLVATSQATLDELGAAGALWPGVPTLVVHPPAPAVRVINPDRRGDRFTLINLAPSKGSGLFLKLAQLMPDIRFLGIEGGYGGPATAQLAALPNVRVEAHVPQAEMGDAAWRHTRVLLMPSAHESWGMVGAEALAHGIPVIASPTPGLIENLGDAGVFIDPADTAQWAAAIRRMTDPTVYAKSSARAASQAASRPKESSQLFVDAIRRLADAPPADQRR